MGAIAYPAIVPIADYLAGEETSELRHEYLGGEVHAMAGGSTDHNLIAQNLTFAFRTHLRGKPCRAFMENVKVNLSLHTDDYFYYPDVMVGCDPRDTHRLYLRFPKLLVEVLSPETERVDRREKFFAYTTALESLEEYVLVAQDRREVTVHRRADGWKPEVITSGKIAFRSLELTLSLDAIYEGVELKT
jgi:Uma2 family endonuclease